MWVCTLLGEEKSTIINRSKPPSSTQSLWSEIIGAHIKPYLVEATSDEVLLEKLTVAVSLENKRQQVTTKKRVSIQAVSMTVTDDTIARLTDGLDKLTAVVMALQERNTTRSPPPPHEREHLPRCTYPACADAE